MSTSPSAGRRPRPPLPCDAGGADALELEIPSDVERIEGVVDAIVARCAARAYPRALCALNVPVALSEALANAILRGNREDAAKRVRVRACVDTEALVVEVEDEGAGFDYAVCYHDPTAPDRIEREDGRGLYLMHTLMDDVELFAADGGGTVVRLTLQRA